MSNRRVKYLAVDDDDGFDDYLDDDYEDEGTADTLTEEDKEQLRLGTVAVREALGPSFAIPDNEIQEALWHYYYDVGKSVSYLKNKYKPIPTPKKQNKDIKTSANNSSMAMAVSVKDFFNDCPWLQVPLHRHAFIVEHHAPRRPGLLGGASKEGKVSKLAALAAKRRQKESSESTDISSQVSAKDDYSETLSKLRISKPGRAGSKADQPEAASAPSTTGVVPKSAIKTTQPQTGDKPEDTASEFDTKQNLRARPSSFASVLVAGSPENPHTNSFSFLAHEFSTKTFDFAEPSPDDIVNKAHNSKASTPSKQKPKDAAKQQTDITNGVGNLSVTESPRVKSKNLDVVAEYKKVKRKAAANFVVIGHVDAGKSTLMGRLLFDLNAVDQRTMDKYRKEAENIGKGSFAFAWILDQGTEERARGVTIDIATNKFETEKSSFTILDAPGHRDFVPNMIAGASQADFAVLVIDASTGNFESGLKGQTKEHALLVRSIGVQRIIVAVNKMDAAGWLQERFEEIKSQMSAFLTSAGFQPKNVSFVPCSGLEGGNILNKTQDPRASWYTGDTLVEELDKSEPVNYALDKPLRMTISDVFRGGVQNPLSVSGRIEAGSLQVEEAVVVMPSGESAYIKSLEVDDEPGEWAVAGQNVVLNLTDIDTIHLKTGDILCSPSSPIRNITHFKAKVLAFDHLTPMSLDIHRGRLHVPARLIQLLAVLDKATGEVIKKKPKIVAPGNVVRVMMELDQPIPLEPPARIVLRSNGETVAAGLIE